MSLSTKATNYAKNVIRTAVPAVVGAILAWITKATAGLGAQWVGVLTPIFGTAYYAGLRWAETKVPSLSWLLGALPAQPEPVPVVVSPSANQGNAAPAPTATK